MLNGHSIRCEITGIPLTFEPSTFGVDFGRDYKLSFGLLGSHILLTKAMGFVSLEDIREAMGLIEGFVQRKFPGKTPYVHIDDYSEVTGSSIAARQLTVDHYRKKPDNFIGLIFHDMPPILTMYGRLAKRLNLVHFSFHVVKTYFQAISIAERLLTDFQEKNCSGKLWAYRISNSPEAIQARNPLCRLAHRMENGPSESAKGDLSQEVERLVDYIGDLDWETQGIVPDRQGEMPDNPLLPVYEAIAVMKMDLDRVLVERDRAFEEKLAIEKRLEQAQKMESIGILANGIAHDFNNILFPIVGMSEMLMEDLDSSSSDWECAEQIFKAGMRGSDLVDQILAFSRQAEHKRLLVRPQKVLEEVVKLARSTAPAQIEIEKNIQTDCRFILADPSKLYRVVINLIANARQAMESQGGRLFVGLREVNLKMEDLAETKLRPGSYAQITVSDTGCGIDPSMINRIFEPYFTTKGRERGTGLGMSVVHGIVQEHHGEIRVESEPARGTTVRVLFPILDNGDEKVRGEIESPIVGGTERILIVDDEELVLKMEAMMLERLGYRVTSRTSSLDALEIFSERPDDFDLVLSDMTMPKMAGDQLARSLMTIRPDIPIIVCTGFSDQMNKENAADLGIRGFLKKPLVKSQMARMVRKVLEEGKIRPDKCARYSDAETEETKS